MTGIKFCLDHFFRTNLVCSAIPLHHNSVPNDLENFEKLTALKGLRENMEKLGEILIKYYITSQGKFG